MASIARGTVWLLLAASTVAVVAATTMPWSTYYVGHSHWAQVEWIPFSRRVRPLDVVLNILLFVPFGYSAFIAGRNRAASGPYLVIGMACLLSLAVELFQVYCHGRLPTMADVLANTAGAWVGTAIGRTRHSKQASSPNAPTS